MPAPASESNLACAATPAVLRRPHGLPQDHFTRNLCRSLSERNHDLPQTHFMELHLFQRFVGISGLKIFHQDENVMPGT